MAIICKKKEIVLNFMEDKPIVHLIAPVKQQQVPFDKLLDEVSSSCGVGRAQVKASIEALLDRMTLFMEYGMSVKLGDFGTFKPTINAKAQENVEDVGVENIKKRKIIFRPGKRFKNMLSTLSFKTVGGTVSEGSPSGGEDDDDDFIDPTA